MSIPASMLPASEMVRAIVDVQVLLPQLPRRLLRDLVYMDRNTRLSGDMPGSPCHDKVGTPGKLARATGTLVA